MCRYGFTQSFLFGTERKSSSQVEYVTRISAREQQMQQVRAILAKCRFCILPYIHTSTWIYWGKYCQCCCNFR